MQIVAKTLGVTLPLALSGRADEVVECDSCWQIHARAAVGYIAARAPT
jgi:hypothetical protein